MKISDTFLKPMHPEGRRFVAIFAAVTAVLFLLSAVLGWLGVGLTVWCYYVFRDPARVTRIRDGLIVSPADGVVSLIEQAVPPSKPGMTDQLLSRVSDFMSVFNCHVNRAPVAVRISEIQCLSGQGKRR